MFFHLIYCNFATVIVCHFLCFLMAFDCQEIKGLLTYLLTYLLTCIEYYSLCSCLVSCYWLVVWQQHWINDILLLLLLLLLLNEPTVYINLGVLVHRNPIWVLLALAQLEGSWPCSKGLLRFSEVIAYDCRELTVLQCICAVKLGAAFLVSKHPRNNVWKLSGV